MSDSTYDESMEEGLKAAYPDNDSIKLQFSARHKFVAYAAPTILSTLIAKIEILGGYCTKHGVPITYYSKTKAAVVLASALYDEILELREPEESNG